jgi:PPP family 3-phenylpropionic acid transporter
MNFSTRPALWMSAAYFTFYAGIACWAPYIVLYYQLLGLSGAQIGILTAIMPLGMVFLAPVWGSLADTWSIHRLILRTVLLITAVVALSLTTVSGFWQVAILIVAFTLFGTTASPLLDSYGVTLGAEKGTSFGQLRVWGSVGYTLVVWLVGTAMGGTVSRLFLFAYAAALVSTCIATLGLPARPRARRRNRPQTVRMWRRLDLQLLFLVTFLLFTSTTPMFSLFGIYIKEVGGTSTTLGLASAVAAISEFPVLLLGNRLVERLGSQRLYAVALGFFVVRLMLYTVAPSTPWIFGAQLLHGCSFGLYLVASMALIYERVGSEHAATAQGFLASAMACGQVVGALLSGVLLDQIGIVAIYGLAAVIVALALVVFTAGRRWSGIRSVPPHLMIQEQPGEL